ncbi:MAG: HlyC/CorC family transporter [Phycisphaerales bacterium]|nr:MAG: HlyC/CorC family transporter [Phycisphaerales bacterium]
MLAQVYQNIGHLSLMFVLLAGSAFFSGAETAFFNLSPRQLRLLRRSEHKLQHLSARLLRTPSRLLSCFLFGNMVVNVLFYAIASTLSLRVGKHVGLTAATVVAAVAFLVLVLFGEILPKSLAYANSKAVSIAFALPALLCMEILRPILFVFRLFIVAPALRLLSVPRQPAKPITTSELKSLIGAKRRDGLISAGENRLLAEVVELGLLKVRHVMQPRVDMVTCAVTDAPSKLRETMQQHNLTKMPIHSGRIDNIVGMVHLRDLLLKPKTPTEKIVDQVHFVPEQKKVESLLEFFRENQVDTAVAVDEYGGIAGLVRLEDIAEELLGPIEMAEGVEPIERIGPFEFRLAGYVAVHDWAEAFGIDPDEMRVSTIGGLVTALLGRMPKTGDVANLRNLRFTVERVQKHRIKSVTLTFEPIS